MNNPFSLGMSEDYEDIEIDLNDDEMYDESGTDTSPTFVAEPNFMREWKILGFTDDDMLQLENELSTNPAIGKLIKGTGGFRKYRFSRKDNNQGKSQGVRVIYIDLIRRGAKIYLTLCDSHNRDDLLSGSKAGKVINYLLKKSQEYKGGQHQ
jgi:hypothetical protein